MEDKETAGQPRPGANKQVPANQAKKENPPESEELSVEELDQVTGGAFQAHISIKGKKQGQFKGEI